jgi:CDGSH-type Zn-finger protein
VQPVTITVYRDGPLLVRGPFSLRASDGGEIPVRRRTIALCRCGRSALAPLCDGSHAVRGGPRRAAQAAAAAAGRPLSDELPAAQLESM